MHMEATPPTARVNGNSFYGTSPIKRHRRTDAEVGRVLTAIKTILAAEPGQITIRHLFYQLVGLHVIPKTELAYKSLCSHLSRWRRSGDIDFGAFADNTRWRYQHDSFDGLQDALKRTAELYRRDLWSTQPCYVEVWVEKDAIASIVAAAANAWGVPVFVARGFASLSSLYSAARTFRRATEAGKRAIIYHLGDYDPSGYAAGDSIKSALRDDFDVDVEFVRAAVTPEQIESLKLPTRPVKTSDGRSKNWQGGDSVEIDTMPPAEIRSLVEDCIVGHIDARQWEIVKTAEADEREKLNQIWRTAA